MPKLEYPKILTNKDWQSKKALGDKVGKNKKTGLGEELDKFQAAFGKTAYAKPSEGLNLVKPVYDPIRFKAELGNARKHFATERKKLEALIVALNKKIDDTAKVVGPTSSTGKHLAKVKQALRDFQLTAMAEHVHQVERAAVKAYAEHLKKSLAFGFVLDKGNPGRRNVAPYADQLRQVRTFADIDHYFNPGENTANPPGRALSTLCQNWDQIMVADFPEYSKKYYTGSAMQTALKGNKWLYELSTPAPSGSILAVATLKAELAKGNGDEAALVTAFRNEALASYAQADAFLSAYFRLIDDMPKALKEL